MRDYGTVLRKAFFDTLKNAIVVNGTTIPIFDEKMEAGTRNDLFIKISSQDVRHDNTKCHFRARCTITLMVVDSTKSVGGKLLVDQVSDNILNILYPTKKTNTLDVAPPYQLVTSYFDTSETFFGKSADGYETGKILYFQNTINQS